MNNFPFFKFTNIPYYNYYNRYKNYSNINNRTNISNSDSINSNKEEKTSVIKIESNKKSSKHNNFGPIRFNFDSLSDSEQPLIEILGIKLYLDDIIILCLLFLLYEEDSHDEGLFICLILLLLT